MPTERETQMLLSAYQAGITSPQELANFMAQVSVESSGLNKLDEGFSYMRGIRQITVDAGVRSALREGPEVLEAARLEAMEGRPERLADLMYGGRMGNDQPGDGYKYHGRGYIQLTGKNQYREAGEALGLDLVSQPELAAQPEHAAAIAVLYWKTNIRAEDRGDVARAGGAINTGDPDRTATHADRRQTKFLEWSISLTSEVMERLSQGEVVLPVVAGPRTAEDPTVRSLQQNLNTLGITDADGRALQIDGNRGGPNSNTNEAIAAFQRQLGVEGQMSDTELLAATQATLAARRPPGVDQRQPGPPERADPAPPAPGIGRPERRDDERDEQLDRQAPNQTQAQTFPTDHKDYALFLAIQQHLPKGTPDEKTAEIMHKAKDRWIEHSDQLEKVGFNDQGVYVLGKTWGSHTRTISLSDPAPSIETTLQQTQALDKQRAEELVQFRVEQEEIAKNPTGPVMTLSRNGPATPPASSGPSDGSGDGGGGE